MGAALHCHVACRLVSVIRFLEASVSHFLAYFTLVKGNNSESPSFLILSRAPIQSLGLVLMLRQPRTYHTVQFPNIMFATWNMRLRTCLIGLQLSEQFHYALWPTKRRKFEHNIPTQFPVTRQVPLPAIQILLTNRPNVTYTSRRILFLYLCRATSKHSL
jgi:hypothetical protein